MFKVMAYKNGTYTGNTIVEDPKAIKTLNMIEAMTNASKSFQNTGIEYDELRCFFVRITVDIAKLNELFLAPTDPQLAALEAKHEAFA